MLGKLLKYEFSSMGRILFPLYGAVILMSIVTSFFMNLNGGTMNNSNISSLLLMLAIMLFFIVTALAVGLSYAMSIYRFRKNMFLSEGYIMNTLPVTAGQHIVAKIIAAVIFELISIFIAVVAYGIVVMIISDVTPAEIFNIIEEVFAEYNLNENKGKIILVFTELSICMIIQLIKFNMSVYAAMAIGHSANNHKILKSIGAYLVFYVIEQIVELVAVGVLQTSSIYVYSYIMNTATLWTLFNKKIIKFIIYYIILLAAYTHITRYFIKNRLNL